LGTQTWGITNSPSSLTEGSAWDLLGKGGQRRQLVVKKISESTLQIEQLNGNDPDAPPLLLNLDFQSDGYSLRWVSLRAESNTFWIFFGPGLPLPSKRSDEASGITLQIAEDQQPSVADGNLTVQRSPEGEQVVWRFATPGNLKTASFETSVTLIPEETAADNKQARCSNQAVQNRP
jgi:hypothetical protein